jgi:CBS domain-containing protein
MATHINLLGRRSQIALVRSMSTRPARAMTISDLAPRLRRMRMGEAPFVVSPDVPVRDAARHLMASRLTFVTACEGGKVVGLLTERNLLQFASQEADMAFFSGNAADRPVRDYMTTRDEMSCIRLDNTLEHTFALLNQRIWRHLPVLDYWGASLYIAPSLTPERTHLRRGICYCSPRLAIR